jgi:arsenate reductase-like glutaredoxin family protein
LPVILWVRDGDAECDDAMRFLKANRYAADSVRDFDGAPPTPDEWGAIAKGLGGTAPATDRVPILLTPKGALVGFRERRWRDFLDIGKGRA